MSRLNIGVLTFHRCINYGSYWQARCLAEGLQARGHQAVLLDHDLPRVNIAEWKCAFQPVLPTHVPRSDYPLYRKKIEGFFRAFELMPLSPRFHLEDLSGMESYDTVVVGSDEVWNLHHPWFGRSPLFWGDGIQAHSLISYAASFGNYNAAWGLEPGWAEKLQNFDMISVRDENSRLIIKGALHFEPELVLDPCLQFTPRPEHRDHHLMDKPYVAVYGHNFSAAFADKIRRFAAQQNLPLVSIGYRNDWADKQWITADPHDFAHFIARSQAVATNFFHGCVFALRNAKPFVCESSPYRSIKVQALMATVGGEQHLLTPDASDSAYHALLSQPIDPIIPANIERLREVSNAYLDDALVIKQLKSA
ncbi:MAG: polysaccharide pyruvyl transferase family protein [Williamsia sp.]|nr:polysaccharide pyruvyl transferase family protein [Williamsia sp.]